MAKKSDNYYFENFIQCVECGLPGGEDVGGEPGEF